tara:strand:- start:135 stop:611 length:477 start_codon:yes stop_codon:yes gene_type:complete
MDFNSNKFYPFDSFQSGLPENNTLSLQKNILYINNLYNSLLPYFNSFKILHLKLIDYKYNTSAPIINDIDGSIIYLEFLNSNTLLSITNFIKKKFIDSNQTIQMIDSINQNVIHNKYSLFVFIQSNIGYAIPLIIDGNDIYLEISYNNDILFSTTHFL